MGIRKKLWGSYDGHEVYLITVSNGPLELTLANFGCTIVSIRVPDGNGNTTNLVLGYDALDDYIQDPFYLGCIVGRFANRLSHACFQIDGVQYQLAANETGTGNHLHGGVTGFNKRVFRIIDTNAEDSSVQFYYRSADGEEGYPGNLDVFVTYSLTDQNEVIIDYKAITDSVTPVNLTNHSYFNLSGARVPATGHELFINTAYVLETGANYIPTGRILKVTGTDLDFTSFRAISSPSDEALLQGLNVCYSLIHQPVLNDRIAALRDPGSGRCMTVRTSLPGIMLYTGDFLKYPFLKNQGICLETQFFPDSPNQPLFPQTLLQPGDVYQHQTVYQFFY